MSFRLQIAEVRMTREYVITRWWWIRHAPVINPDRIYYGQRDLEADLDHQADIDFLAERLPAQAQWFVSPLKRTHQTARAIQSAAARLHEPTIEPAFIEQNFGDWQKMKAADVYAAQGREHPLWKEVSPGSAPNGERFENVMTRVHGRIGELTKANAGQDLVVVAHAGTIRAATALALGLDWQSAAVRLTVTYLSLTRLNHIDDGQSPFWMVEAFNVKPT
ncbi:MAG: histidine phosphatase family protein [Pseudomonadota bacterium]